MNIFSLFESENDKDLLLGIEVIKTLNKQKEFEKRYEVSFDYYLELFDKFSPLTVGCFGSLSLRFEMPFNSIKHGTKIYSNHIQYHYLLIILCSIPKSIRDLAKIDPFNGINITFKEHSELLNIIEEIYLNVVNNNNLIQPYFNSTFSLKYVYQIQREEILEAIKLYFK